MAPKIQRKKRVNTDEEIVTVKPKVNVQATKGTKANQKVLKEGTPLEHSKMHNVTPTSPTRTVGVNVGITKNMGDFESLRVDCWITDEILEGETQQEALARLGEIASDELARQVELLAE